MGQCIGPQMWKTNIRKKGKDKRVEKKTRYPTSRACNIALVRFRKGAAARRGKQTHTNN